MILDIKQLGLKPNLLKKIILKKIPVKLPFDLGRTIRGVKFDYLKNDIMGSCIIDLFYNRINSKDFAEILYDRYQLEKKCCISDFLPFKVNQYHEYYKKPLRFLVYPWENISTTFSINHYDRIHEINRKKESKIKQRIKLYSYEDALSQATQTINLIKSINKIGWRDNNKTLPTAVVISNGRKLIWHMSRSGNHRAYLRYALGYKYLTARVQVFTSTVDLKNWQNINSNSWSINDALNIFNNLYEGINALRGSV
tara:strand:+ start:5162 stop:5923 length:762 start_codon:yes stop_codon:yes gene_type:complete